jgi:hypothetical protein
MSFEHANVVCAWTPRSLGEASTSRFVASGGEKKNMTPENFLSVKVPS